jgi:hypothetical protein
LTATLKVSSLPPRKLGDALSGRVSPDFLRKRSERVADVETDYAAAVACAYTRDDCVCFRTGDGTSVFGIPGVFAVAGGARGMPASLPIYTLPAYKKRGVETIAAPIDRLHRAGD